MNELNLYAIIEAILKKSKVIQGRFHVAPGEGSELNTNALDEMVTDMLGSITTTGKKYPLSLMLPPVEIVNEAKPGWSRFKVRLFFLTSKSSVDGQLKNLHGRSNTSGHTTMMDWKDMRECSQDFIKAFEYTLKKHNALDKIRPVDSEPIFVERYTKLGNDKANGVSISMAIDLYMPCETEDYNNADLDSLTLNLGNIHPLHAN